MRKYIALLYVVTNGFERGSDFFLVLFLSKTYGRFQKNLAEVFGRKLR